MDASSTVPLWKQEFLAKKKALRDYQRKSSEKLLSNQESQDRNVGDLRGADDQRIDSNARAELADNVVLIEQKHNGYHGLRKGSPLQDNGHEDNVSKSHNHIEEIVTRDSEHCEAQDNVESDESDRDSDCSSGDEDGGRISNGRTGGYSFVTGETVAADSDSSGSSSEVTDELANSESGVAELKYKPGFVSQLLNKFSNMSYQGQTLANGTPFATTSNSLPSLPATQTPFKNTRQPPSFVSNDKREPSGLTERKPVSQFTETVIDLTSPRASGNVEPALPGKPKDAASEVSVKNLKTNPYRAPSEIILIEGTSSKTVSPRSPTEEARLPSPRSTHATDVSVAVSPSDERSAARERLQHLNKPASGSIRQVEGKDVAKTIPAAKPEIIIISKEPVGDVPSTPKPAVVSPEPNKVSTNVVSAIKPPPRRSKLVSPTDTPAPPLFASIKLRPTRHRLYERGESSEQEVVSPVAGQPPNRPLSPFTKPAVPAGDGEQKNRTSASQLIEVTEPKDVSQANSSVTSKNVKISLADIPDKNRETTPKITFTQVSVSANQNTRNSQPTIKIEESVEPANRTAVVAPTANWNIRNSQPTNEIKESADPANRAAVVAPTANQVTSNLSDSSEPSKDVDVVEKTTTVNKFKPPTAKSLRDIPSPAKESTSLPSSNGESDLQVVLRRRKEKSTATDLPVTNIDDVLAPRRGSGSRVFDTRKSMGRERKVPEYEKIHDGPTVDFTDGKVVVGQGCLKVTSATGMKKNLSFNDIELSEVHEYPSEKLLIQHIAKEKDAVYWDDPDHLQAAPDRSADELEPESTKSSLRSALTGTPSALGSLASHKPSHHQEFKFGQSSASPAQREDDSKPAADDDVVDGLRIKPADEQEVKSWSSDGTSDILF